MLLARTESDWWVTMTKDKEYVKYGRGEIHRKAQMHTDAEFSQCHDCGKHFIYLLEEVADTSIARCMYCVGRRFGIKEMNSLPEINKIDPRTGLSYVYEWRVPIEDLPEEIQKQLPEYLIKLVTSDE